MIPIPSPGNDSWPATLWTVVGSAGDAGDDAARKLALEKLCRAYDRPILAVLRDMGFTPSEAEDVRQRFLVDVVIGRSLFAKADPARGRVRDLLKSSLHNFACNIRRDAATKKRGGGRVHEDIETAQLSNPPGKRPDELFEREWAQAILDRTWEQLETEFCAKGKASLWQELRPHLERWSGPESQVSVAARLGLSPSLLSTELNRLRTRFRHILHLLVSETASSPADADADLQHLRHILSQ